MCVCVQMKYKENKKNHNANESEMSPLGITVSMETRGQSKAAEARQGDV